MGCLTRECQSFLPHERYFVGLPSFEVVSCTAALKYSSEKQIGALWVGVDEDVTRGVLEQTDKQGVGEFRKR